MMNETGKTLLIRTDSTAAIGTGHLMRCLALAQAWQDMGRHVIFAMSSKAPPLEIRLCEEGVELVRINSRPGSIEDVQEIIELAKSRRVRWVVVDGYYFDADYQRRIKDGGLNLLFIDDYGHAEYYWADIVLNQNIYAHEGLYINRAPYTKLLLGIRYVLLRREFWRWRGWKREIPDIARKVLVTLGGADTDNMTLKVIRALEQIDIDGLEAIVVAGSINPHYELLQLVVQNTKASIYLKRGVKNMPELMAWADVAISAGGISCWELAFMGLPSLIIILAEHQYAIAEALNQAGVAVNLGWYLNLSSPEIAAALSRLLFDKDHRAKMTRNGQQIVDVNGVFNILKEINAYQLSSGESI